MRKTAAATFLVFCLALCVAASSRRYATVDRVETSSTIVRQIMSAPDSAIPDSIMSGAKCVAIVPSALKASFVFGANYGKGVATCRTAQGWSSPVFFLMTGGSFGFQAGGQASDLVLIIRTDEGMQHLLQSKFKLGADASAAAGPVGRDAQAATDITMRAQILTYSRSRGLFLGVSLAGAVIRQDEADTQAFYGKNYTYYSLLKGEVPPIQQSEVLLNTVERYAPTRKASLQKGAPVPAPAAAPAATTTEIPATTSSMTTSMPAKTPPSTASQTSAVASDTERTAADDLATAPTTKAPASVATSTISGADDDANH